MSRIHRYTASHSLLFSLSVAFVIALPAEPVLAAGEIVDTVERAFTVTGRPSVFLKNLDGRNKITTGPDNQVRVKAVKEVRRAATSESARRAAERVELRIEQVGGRIEIEARYPNTFSIFGLRPEVRVHFEVTVPASSDVEARSVDGPIEIEGIGGHINLKSVDGAVSSYKCSGRIEVRSTDGNLKIDGARGEVRAQSTDGSITIEGTIEALEVRSTDGRIDVTVFPESTMSRGWNIQTTDGNVRVRLPEAFSADLDLRTNDGRINSEHSISLAGTISNRRLSGKLEGGGNLLRIHTTDGNIEILK